MYEVEVYGDSRKDLTLRLRFELCDLSRMSDPLAVMLRPARQGVGVVPGFRVTH